ncbi:MAG: DUF2237 domain-containing protein [Opitutales bacterium]|nr:DUF2237 domain-containing protein [Opitutales bacterium]
MASNVFGEPLVTCSDNPKTGFFRNGCCDTCAEDVGQHTVCARMTVEFLEFSQSRGNDLSTPRPEFQFPGLKEGDFWCICMNRWFEAYEAGMAPKLKLEACHISLLEFADMEILEKFAVAAN